MRLLFLSVVLEEPGTEKHGLSYFVTNELTN